MNTLKIKSILATLAMVLMSGSAWADTYEDHYFYYSGIWCTESYSWEFNVEAGDVLTFDWNIQGYEDDLNIDIYSISSYISENFGNWGSGKYFYTFEDYNTYVLNADFINNGTFNGGWSSAQITNIKILRPFSSNGFEYLYDRNGSDAYLVSCSLSGKVEIPSSIKTDDGKTYNVIGIRKDAFKDCTTITSVALPSSITSLPENTFEGCTNLTSVTIPSSITRLPEYMFKNCTSLTSVTIPSSITVLPHGIFLNCTSLTSVTIPSSVTSLESQTFQGCTSLTSVTIPSSVTSLGSQTFQGCTSLTSVTIPSSVTSLGLYVFKGCTNLKSVTIPSSITHLPFGMFNNCTSLTTFTIPASVKSLDSDIFDGCTSLTSVTIPSSITALPSGIFSNCTSLTSITIPSSVTYLYGNMFDGCNNLESIIANATTPPTLYNANSLPYRATIFVSQSNVTTYKNADGWNAHKDQIMAIGTKIDYDLTGANAVTADAGMSVLHARIGEEHLAEVVSLKVEGTINSYDLMVMRNKMVGLRHLDLSKATIIANSYEYYTGYNSVDNTLTYWALNDNLHTVKLPKTLKKINTNALSNLKFLGELEIPASVTEIANEAAKGITSLKSLTFANNSQCVTIGNYAFSSCSALTSVTIPSSITSIGSYAFNGCPLNYVTFEDGESTLSLGDGNYYRSINVHNRSYYSYSPFGNCPIQNLYIGRKLSYSNATYRLCTYNASLKSVEFGEYVSVIDAAQFAGCTNLEEVKGLEYINSIGEGAFYRCSKLESLTIPSNVTKIEPWAFRQSGLKSMNIPAGVKTLGEYAFADCANLETFTFSNDCEVTAIPDYFLYYATKLNDIALPKNTLTIGNYAFYGCTLMQECKISSKITKIGDYAFNQCNNLNSVYAYTFEPQAIDQNTFSTYHTATLHIPSASYLLYFYDTQWSQFLHLVGFDSEAEQIGINVDYHLYTETNGIIGGKPRVDIQGKGGLTVIGDRVQPFGDIHITATDNLFGSLVANGNVTADKIYFDINVNKDKWYFFCFPFDIPMANITKSGSFKWAMYDGNARALNGTSGWKNLPDGTTMLLKGKGYIFRTNFEGELSLRVDKPTFEAVNEETTLTSYVSSNEANANWNMVGNPYPCYYPINKLQYGAPIVVWNGSGYDAYRPGDDDYILHPFEAMFVQKPQSVSSIGFLAEWRQTYTGSHPVSNNAKTIGYEDEQAENSRRFVNLTLSHGNLTDKTRVVLNEAQSVKYEQECDAAKFESTEIPQIYTLNTDGTKFAINERPMENGRIALGFYAPEEGMYTFSATRMDVKAYIYDSMTSATYDLSEGEFTFNAEQGTDNTRFTLIFADEATGINGLPASYAGADKIYDLGGRKMNDAKTGVVIKNGKKVTMK